MACHTEGWAERRKPPSADRNWLRHLAAPAGCRQEGKIFLARTVVGVLKDKTYHQIAPKINSYMQFALQVSKQIRLMILAYDIQ